MNTPAPAYGETAQTNGHEFTQGEGYHLPEYPFVPPPELARSDTVRHPIVIVGAGLTGLTLAASLARLGVPAVLLDEDNTVGVKGAASRGICYAQKSLEIFQRIGVFDRIAAKGIQWNVGRTFAGQDEVYTFDLRQQQSFNLSQQPPFINLQQFYVEGYLVERIAELGLVELRWRNRLVDFEQNKDVATLTVETPAGRYRIEAEHVIDTSGAHSPLRQWLKVPVTGYHGDDRWCLADVRFGTRPPVERRTWIEAPFNDNRAVWQHLMADDVWRIDYQMPSDSDPAEACREEVVRERLARQFGAEVPVEVVWAGPYAYRNECVDQMRSGRVFFVGDAAKVVSPFGARGGNTGIADADNLAWKLAAVLRGQAPPKLLDSYHAERHQAATDNVRVTSRTARFLRPGNGVEHLFRNAALSLARQQAFARALVNTGRMSVATTYTRSPVCSRGSSHAGESVQNAVFRWAGNGNGLGCLNDLLRWADGRLLVLVFGDLSLAACERLADLSRHAPLRSVQVLDADATPQAVEHIRDVNPRGVGHLQGACHVFGHAWALVRPDGHLAATGEAVDASLVHAVETALAVPTFL
ncbi:FAD-dependent monooxygenase [Hydrogenophaga sp. OTU3427]|uniref:FAD-dependent monooxygenase n=1 Tax=Hydrogenophaga sp. OTU3427 TaxID=3043856 RepID=UPI00313B317F